jgi:autophagy-related protein 5
VGVLFDLHTAFDPSSEGGHTHLPWHLTLHFQDYPKDVLTRRDSSLSVQDMWLNNLKEVPTPYWIANQTSWLQHGSAKKIYTLHNSQVQTLWQSLLDLDYTTYNSIYLPLTTSPRHIPLRIFLPPPHPPITPLVTRMISSVEEQTLGTALHSVLPPLFPSRRTCLFARPTCHGVAVPLGVALEKLATVFASGQGWLDIVILMMN